MRFLVKSPLSHDNVDYEVGATVEMTAAQAAAAPWAVEALPELPDPPVAKAAEKKVK
jgi:hypothetical protein